jgi:MFS family permease
MIHNARSTQESASKIASFYPFDGLIDLFTGFGLLLAGLFAWAGMFWLAGIYPALFMPLWQSSKKQITEPRLDQASLDPAQKRRLARAGMLWIGLFLGLLLVGVIFFLFFNDGVLPEGWRTWLGEYLPLVLGLGAAIVIALTALIGQMPHWLINGVAIALLTGIGFWQSWAGWLIITLSGGVFLLTGSVLLVQFLRQNPLPAPQA